MVEICFPEKIEISEGGETVHIFEVGYESGEWRCSTLVNDFMFDHLCEFALGPVRASEVNHKNSHRMLVEAAMRIYRTDKYDRRGEFGELLLHALLVSFYNVEPLLSKIQFKTSANDTVKGFDSVHIAVANKREVHLWMGESKLYADAKPAIRQAVSGLCGMLTPDKLREEFALFVDKIPPTHPHRDTILSFIHSTNSLDNIIPNLRIPILITYSSPIISKHSEKTESYLCDLKEECLDILKYYQKRNCATEYDIKFILMFLPTKSVKQLREIAHNRLVQLQGT